MPQITKPDTLNVVWADQGMKIKPEDSKILRGWIEEIPPLQFFNWLDSRQDQAIAHINQHGIPVWDAVTEYQAGKSYVQGANGTVYRCTFTNFGNDPISSQSYWEEAFTSTESATALQRFIGYEVQSASFSASPNSRYYIAAPLVVTLPLTGTVGQVVTLVKRPNLNITVRVSSGVIVTSSGSDANVIYDIDDEVNFVFNGTSWEV